LSIVLNIAAGAGKLSKLEKRRYYMTARGSATESAALLGVCYQPGLLDATQLSGGKDLVVRIVSMLVKLARSCEGS
jgi:four helix bundle protein